MTKTILTVMFVLSAALPVIGAVLGASGKIGFGRRIRQSLDERGHLTEATKKLVADDVHAKSGRFVAGRRERTVYWDLILALAGVVIGMIADIWALYD